MSISEFDSFRLVGGTALSLQLGHRISVDIDLFTDTPYGNIDFSFLEHRLRDEFHYVDQFSNVIAAIGTHVLPRQRTDFE